MSVIAAVAFAASLVAQSFLALPVDGITCDSAEGAMQHIHAHLALYDRGKAVPVPAGIGIVPASSCLYWLHTHTADGIIHIEAPVTRAFTLGQFFDIWDRDLGWKHPALWVNGKPLRNADVRSIVLRDHESIVIENGPPYVAPPRVNWQGL